MKAKIKSKLCQVSGCKRKWTCIWRPKKRQDKALKVCAVCLERNDKDEHLWKLVDLCKPEHIPKAKTVNTKNHKPKREGKPAWQTILDNWFAKGRYPIGNFMNLKRWTYWISIGGKKSEGDSRKFDTTVKAVVSEDLSKIKKAPKGKVRRKR